MLAQALITGTEFVIDAVSCDGRHHVVSLAYYRKDRGAQGGPIYREMIFVPPSEWDGHREVIDYAFAVLDALGVTVGPSHTEVFVDEDGPVLVESGARLCGAMVPLYLEAVSSNSPLDLAVLSYVDPARFHAAAARPQSQHALLHIYMMMNRRRGRVTARPGESLLAALPTVRDVYWYVAEGAEVIPTRDLLSGLGLIFLIGPDRAALEADIARIRQWEEDGTLIEVEEPLVA
jgi:L-amino acid ligase